MKRLRIFLLIAAALGSALATGSASAWHRGGPRVSVGLHFGVPLAAFPYYYPPYPYYYPAYYPAPIVVQPAPVTYVEQPPPQAQPAAPTGYWYYCNDARAYYPYVRECPGGWQRVAPQPSN